MWSRGARECPTGLDVQKVISLRAQFGCKRKWLKQVKSWISSSLNSLKAGIQVCRRSPVPQEHRLLPAIPPSLRHFPCPHGPKRWLSRQQNGRGDEGEEAQWE